MPVNDEELSSVEEYIFDNKDVFLEDLYRLLSIPSISTSGQNMEDCIELIHDMCKRYGFDDFQRINTSGQPSLLARAFVEGQDNDIQPTILIYGHYDVQPVDRDTWTTPPFEPTVRQREDGDKRIYARGAGDNKGQWFAHLCAIRTLRETDSLPINVILFLEGEEENGSPNIRSAVRTISDLIHPDLLYIADGPIDESGRPHLLLGSRGLLYIQVDVDGPNRDLHSGNYGGPIPNPAWVIVHLLNSIKDDSGIVGINGFYDNVRDITEADLDVVDEIPLNRESIKSDLNINSFSQGPGKSYYEKLMYYPTFNIAGLSSGYKQEGKKTIIPAEAQAKIDIRLVPDQDPDEIYDLVSKHIQAFCPPSINYRITRLGSMKPHRTPLDSQFCEPILNAIEQSWNKKPILKPSIGASGPDYAFVEQFDIDCFYVPYANYDENNHAPDENISINCFEKGIRTTIQVLKQLRNPNTIESS